MTTPAPLSPKEFVTATGLTRQTFYNCLKAMKAAKLIPLDTKRIDMSLPWMVNYMAGAGVGQRKGAIVPGATPQRFTAATPVRTAPAGTPGTIPDTLPDLARLTHVEQYEKVRKMQIDNESKLKNLFARPLVQFLVEHFDDFFIKLIVDGESSLVPRLFDKAQVKGSTVEDCKKIYRQEMSKRIKGVKAKIIKAYKDMIE